MAMASSAAILPKFPPYTPRFTCVRLSPLQLDTNLFPSNSSKLYHHLLSSFRPVRILLPCIHSVFDDSDDFDLMSSPESDSESNKKEPNRNLTDFWVPDYLGDPGESVTGGKELYDFSSESNLDVEGKDKVEERDGFVKVGWRWKRKKIEDGMYESVMEVRRVSRMTAGGRRYRYRLVVAVGDRQGKVGVGVGKALDISDAVQKAARDARKYIVEIPLTHHLSFPHRTEAKYKGAKILLMPGFVFTGLRCGGAVKQMLDMAGVRNALGKQVGTRNKLSNARAVLLAINKMRYFQEHALARGVPRYQVFKNMRDFNTHPPP